MCVVAAAIHTGMLRVCVCVSCNDHELYTYAGGAVTLLCVNNDIIVMPISDTYTDGWMDGWMNGWMNGWMDG